MIAQNEKKVQGELANKTDIVALSHISILQGGF